MVLRTNTKSLLHELRYKKDKLRSPSSLHQAPARSPLTHSTGKGTKSSPNICNREQVHSSFRMKVTIIFPALHFHICGWVDRKSIVGGWEANGMVTTY